MGYDDRMNNEFAATIRADMKEARDADLAKAGPLLSIKQEAQLENFLTSQCWLTPADARDVVDTIKSLSGEDDTSPKQIIKDALEGHVKPAFLKNDANFSEPLTLLTGAIEAREERIKVNKAADAAAPTASKSAPAVKPPGQG